ncbi:MAG: hypothetical protein RIF34_05395, partial [Candidatus Kapaibacterium sp.]
MTTSEKLHLLLDGELDGIDTAEVLNKVSNSPELTQEFVDLVKMKQMMRGASEAPPDHLRRTVMAGIGLGGSGLWYYLQNSGMVAASAAFISSKVGAAIIAGMIGVFATFMVMDNNEKPTAKETIIPTISNAQFNELASAMPIDMEVPVVSSVSKNTNSLGSRLNKNGSNSNTNRISATTTTKEVSTNSENIAARNTLNNNFYEVSESNREYYTNQNVEILPVKDEEIAMNQEISPIVNNENPSGFIINPTNRIMTAESEQQMLFSLQGRGITNNSLLTPDMSTTEAPAI